MAQIFVSYSRVDESFTVSLVGKLRRVYQYENVWFDEGLHGGDIWWQEILNEIAECDIFLYVLSNESVQSEYCQAEFEEARRLQKQTITVQARDRTRLTEKLRDIHYIDMSSDENDAGALAELIRSINKQMTKVPKRRPKPLWEPPTPKPTKITEKPRVAETPHVDTPTLELPLAEMEHRSSTSAKPKGFRIPISVLILVVLVLVIGLIGLVIVVNNANNQSQAPTALAQVASPDIAIVVATLDAEATIFQATTIIQATAAARATDYAIGTQSIANQTATATQWTATPTLNITASIQAHRTNVAATSTQAWKDSSTNTPTPTPQDGEVVQNAFDTWNSTPNTPSPEQLALTPVIQNVDWIPLERQFGNIPMLLVPTGCFEMGRDNGKENEKPIHEQCFDKPFWIDKYEVTREQYEVCVNTSQCEETPGSSFSTEHTQPINQITWHQAQMYCAFRLGRLPTEREWEYAARGPNNFLYPWGNVWNATITNWSIGLGTVSIMSVGSFPTGRSWVGAMDMTGNVSEWTSSQYDNYPYDLHDGRERIEGDSPRVFRGGSFLGTATQLVTANREQTDPSDQKTSIGFRCVRDFE